MSMDPEPLVKEWIEEINDIIADLSMVKCTLKRQPKSFSTITDEEFNEWAAEIKKDLIYAKTKIDIQLEQWGYGGDNDD